MTAGPPFARRFRWPKLLRASLVAGALYDLAVAALLVAAPGPLSRLTGLPMPGERFYLLLIAVLVTMLAALYLLAASDPRRYSGVIAVAIAGRLAAAACLAAAAAGRPDLGGLYPLAGADAAFALAHAACWWPIRS
jgi:hypothetical protein